RGFSFWKAGSTLLSQTTERLGATAWRWETWMQVNVFISKPVGGNDLPTLVVLPYEPLAAVPRHLRGMEWDYLATTSPADKLIGATATAMGDGIARDGYVRVSPTG